MSVLLCVVTNRCMADDYVSQLPCDDARSTDPPPFLELDDNQKFNYQWSQHPFFERLLRIDDVEGLAGVPIHLPKYLLTMLVECVKHVRCA